MIEDCHENLTNSRSSRGKAAGDRKCELMVHVRLVGTSVSNRRKPSYKIFLIYRSFKKQRALEANALTAQRVNIYDLGSFQEAMTQEYYSSDFAR